METMSVLLRWCPCIHYLGDHNNDDGDDDDDDDDHDDDDRSLTYNAINWHICELSE